MKVHVLEVLKSGWVEIRLIDGEFVEPDLFSMFVSGKNSKAVARISELSELKVAPPAPPAPPPPPPVALPAPPPAPAKPAPPAAPIQPPVVISAIEVDPADLVYRVAPGRSPAQARAELKSWQSSLFGKYNGKLVRITGTIQNDKSTRQTKVQLAPGVFAFVDIERAKMNLREPKVTAEGKAKVVQDGTSVYHQVRLTEAKLVTTDGNE